MTKKQLKQILHPKVGDTWVLNESVAVVLMVTPETITYMYGNVVTVLSYQDYVVRCLRTISQCPQVKLLPTEGERPTRAYYTSIKEERTPTSEERDFYETKL